MDGEGKGEGEVTNKEKEGSGGEGSKMGSKRKRRRTLLEIRDLAKERESVDLIRRRVMGEPRGWGEMYVCFLVILSSCGGWFM